MEYVIVRYARKRSVYIDGEDSGETGERLRVEEGTHTIHLGDPRDYPPKWRRPQAPPQSSRWRSSSRRHEPGRGEPMRLTAATLIGVTVLAAGCARYPMNHPIRQYDRDYGYRFSSVATTGDEDETFLILSFSGGGTRAAALAYGVLQHLAKTPIGGGRRSLLDEVDVISSVSGGSFTAAFFALNGLAALPDFEARFLRQNVERALLKEALFNPYNWWRLLSPTFSRIDLAAEYYDKHVFDGRTYADLLKRRQRPYLVVNATEMDLGARFDFTQERFDPICSDLQALAIGRAVAASSAFPVLLTPVTLRNYSGTCGYQEPEWVANALGDYAVNQRRYRSALELREYIGGGPPVSAVDGRRNRRQHRAPRGAPRALVHRRGVQRAPADEPEEGEASRCHRRERKDTKTD